ncbi:MAG TPA: hypothetical protein DIV86_06110, partial [Alphaproteobacteria bacterium]|nr:hypothetical protein [Alphaproteobacteria bacterium]
MLKMSDNEILMNVKSRIEGVTWPPVPVGVSAVLANMMNQLDMSQWLPAKILEKRQYEQLAKLVEHSEKYSPHFANRLKQSGLTTTDICTPKGFRKLPILTRRDIQQAGDAIHCTEIPKSHLPVGLAKTSGSTGEPLVVKKTTMNHLMWQSNMLREHLWHKRDFSGRVFNVRAQVKEP